MIAFCQKNVCFKSIACINKFRYLHNISSHNLKIEKISKSEDKNQKKNDLFDKLLETQKNLITRIDKIEVKMKNIQPFEDMTLLMNKNLSTPLNCAQHISQDYVKRSVMATVNGKSWDMERPLEKNCEITLHHFKENSVEQVNCLFWRTCSFLLGKVIKDSFKNEIPVFLHSWPKPNYRLGSFIYDAQIPSLNNWRPKENELLTLTKVFHQLSMENLPIQRLQVGREQAFNLVEGNDFKISQIKKILNENSEASLVFYRVGNHIDFSIGPMLPNTSFLGKINVSAVYPLKSSINNLYRFQGVALPKQLPMHFFAFKQLVNHSKNYNDSPIPQ